MKNKKEKLMMALAACAIATASCGKKESCNADDAWGLVGQWNGQMVLRLTENGKAIGVYPDAYEYRFHADGTGIKKHVAEDTLDAFEWRVAADGDRMTFYFQSQDSGKVVHMAQRFMLQERTATRIVLQDEVTMMRVVLPSGDTTETVATTDLILEKR